MRFRLLAQVISGLALVGTIGPPLAYLAGALDLDRMKIVMFVAAIAWFVATPLWMGRDVRGPDLGPSDG